MLAVVEQKRSAGPATATARVVVAIPALNEQDSIGDVIAGIPRDIASRIIVADGGSTDATAARAESAGAHVIAAGKGYGRACWQAAVAAPDAGIIAFMDGDGADDPMSLHALIAPIHGGQYDFVIGSRARGERAPGSIAWHQLAAGDRGLRHAHALRVRYTDMCAFRAIRRQASWIRHARNDLWLEHRDADAGGASRIAHSRNTGSVSLPHRRQIEGGRQPAREPAGGPAHPHHVLPGRRAADRAAPRTIP